MIRATTMALGFYLPSVVPFFFPFVFLGWDGGFGQGNKDEIGTVSDDNFIVLF